VTIPDLIAEAAEVQGAVQAFAGHDPVSQTRAGAYAAIARIEHMGLGHGDESDLRLPGTSDISDMK